MKDLKKKFTTKIKAIKKLIKLKMLLPLIYCWYKRKPINNNLVVFADHRDRPMLDSFVGLYNMCKENGYECVFLSGSSFGKEVSPSQRKKNKTRFYLDFIKFYAQARAVFLVDYFPVLGLLKAKPSTAVIQLWHGCGAMKVVGYSARGTKWAQKEKEWKRYPIHKNYTLAPVSSETVIPCYEDAFGLEKGSVKALGVPRTDIYFDKVYVSSARNRVLTLFPEIGSRKIILYAPTYRGNSIKKSNFDISIDYPKLMDALKDEYVLLTKFHPLMAKAGLSQSMRLQCKGFVYDGTQVLTPEEAVCACDIMVGDYSSMMFEYMLLNRPMISYIPDIDQYTADRGFFFPYDETMPGPYVFDEAGLLEKIKTVDTWYDEERTKQYCEKFMSACDGHSTERIFNEVFHNENGGIRK